MLQKAACDSKISYRKPLWHGMHLGGFFLHPMRMNTEENRTKTEKENFEEFFGKLKTLEHY
jgi:hypothetical protein